jgi:predicted acetyltransferase
VDIEIRPFGPDRYREFMEMMSVAFGEDFDPKAELEVYRPIFEASRTWGAFDGGQVIGAAADTEFGLTVPGGMVSASGVSAVAVLPTHRRRGIMRALLRRQTDEAHDSGRPVSYLWASEGAIYQRVGYGVGTLAAGFEIDRQHTAFLRPVEPTGRIRLVNRDEALKLLPIVYDRLRSTRPGMVSQTEAWWEEIFRHSDHHREKGTSSLFFAIRESTEGADGYLVYRVKDDWTDAGPDQTLVLEELVAATDEAYAELWTYCFSVDLVRHIKGWKRPIDEPLLLMLAEPRALRFKVRDGAWLRIIDLAEALGARRYAMEGRLRLDVRDEFCPWNQGRWELEGGPDGASCGRTDSGPDLLLNVADLAAMYLGAVRPSTLARAGRVEERTAGSITRADAMFATDVAPWCPHVF